MTKQIFGRLIIGLIVVGVFAMPSFAQTKSEPQTQSTIPQSPTTEANDTLVYKALQQISSAQATYSATTGNGNYAVNLQALADFELFDQVLGKDRKLELIDQALGRGEKYGYYFWVMATPAKNNKPSFFTATATPSQYPKTGRRSFYVDSTGVIRGADRNGAIASANDPFIIICGESEWEAIQSLRALHGAEITYQSAVGNGNFGTLKNLESSSLIHPLMSLANRCGYRFTLITTKSFSNNPANFYISAVPQKYPLTGRRSFYMDTSGVIRGADKNGAVATVNDPIIIICGDNETAAMQSLRTIHGAEATYQAVSENGNFGSLSDLQSKDLIDLPMSQGNRCGYRFVLTISERDNSTNFNIIAVPQKYGETGRRSFYMDESGVIRGADRNGQPANADDPPIDFQN